MFAVKVDRAESLELHEQVASEIRRAIAEGEAPPGERLPPARAAATRSVEARSPTRTLTWYGCPPRRMSATAPRPEKHSKLGRWTVRSFRSGARPSVHGPPPALATVFQRTITTTARVG